VLKLAIVLLLSLTTIYCHSNTLKEVEYNGFTLWMDCSENLAVMAKYSLTKDIADYKKPTRLVGDYRRSYYREGRNEGCRQLLSSTYQSQVKHIHDAGKPAHPYDNGHLVSANHMDSSQASIADSMHMDNIFPQVARFNRPGGAWYYTEKITECLRDGTDIDVYLGLIMGNDAGNDHFINSHGVRTPDFAWKILHRKDTNTIQTYLMPNSYESTESNMMHYVVGIEHLLSKLTSSKVKGYLKPLKSLNQDLKTWIVSGSRELFCGKYSASNS